MYQTLSSITLVIVIRRWLSIWKNWNLNGSHQNGPKFAWGKSCSHNMHYNPHFSFVVVKKSQNTVTSYCLKLFVYLQIQKFRLHKIQLHWCPQFAETPWGQHLPEHGQCDLSNFMQISLLRLMNLRGRLQSQNGYICFETGLESQPWEGSEGLQCIPA